MAKKKLTKTLWYGSEKDVDGNPIVPNIAPSVEKHLEGINEGEIYIHNDDANPSIFIRTNADKVVGIGGAEALSKHFLRKDKPDTAKEKITFEKGVEVGKYESGTLGTGGAVLVDEDGNSVAEFDYATFRKKVIFNNITVKELKHIGGEFILSPASMVCSRVEDTANGYKCYFNQKDYEGRQLFNEFEVGDQAKCQTFTLKKNTYYWRLVTEVGDNYIVLSKNDYDKSVPNDVPKEGDNISLLGNRNEIKRQKAIVISAFDEDAPSYKQYKGINSYSLEGCRVTKLSPNGNELTGKLNIETGSSGWENLSGLPENIQEAVDLANKAQETIDNTTVGAVNLLRNSGFTGDYLTEDLTNKEVVDTLSEMYSKQLIYWDGEGSVSADANAVSGYSVKVGNLSQTVSALISKENYVISFKAKGTSVSVACGGFFEVQALTTLYKEYSFKFAFSGSKKLNLSGDATLCDIQLERGTIATDWGISPLDNEKAYSEFLGMSYMYDAIKNGATSILGGLILSTMMQLGNYKKSGNNMVGTTTAGISGIYNNEDDVAFWGGGTYEQAIKTVMKFKENPRFKPTSQEWLDLANYVVTHGGDAIYRGLVYADGGYFRGAVDIANGKILLDDDGSGHFANKAIRWTPNGIMYRRSREILEWINVMTFPNNVINYDKGTLFDMRIGLSTEADATYTLETPSERGFTISVGLVGALSRSMQSAILSGSFSVITYSEEDNQYVSVSCNKFQLDFKTNIEYQLTWMGDFWEVRGGNASVKDGVATMGGQSVIIVGSDSSSEEGEEGTGSRVVISENKVVSKAFETPTKSFTVDEYGSVTSAGNVLHKMGAKSVLFNKNTQTIALLDDSGKSVLDFGYGISFGEPVSWGKITLNHYTADGESLSKSVIITPDDITVMDWVTNKGTVITPSKVTTSEISTDTINAKNITATGGITTNGINSSGAIVSTGLIQTSKNVSGGTLTASSTSDSSIATEGGISASKGVSCKSVNASESISGNSVSASTYKVGSSDGLSKEITINDTEGTHVLTFSSGLLTAHSFTANSTES